MPIISPAVNHSNASNQGASSINPASDCKDLYHGEEVSGGLLEPGRQASHVFHFAEEALDNVSLEIEIVIVRDCRPLVVFHGDYGDCGFVGNLLPDLAAAVGFVRDDGNASVANRPSRVFRNSRK